jgi:hypothetical protein
VLDLLEETGLLGSKPIKTPLDPNVKLNMDQGNCYLIRRDIVIWLPMIMYCDNQSIIHIPSNLVFTNRPNI